jgi:hypothetical protein
MWAALGIPLTDVDLPELGVVVLVSWEGGLEIMSPVHETGTHAEQSRQFLAEKGEGVFSVVFNVPDLDAAIAGMEGMGGEVVYREDITPDEFEDREIAGEGTDTPVRQLIRQAVFAEIAGIRLCAQEVTVVE